MDARSNELAENATALAPILVVDDDVGIREMLADALSETGRRVETCADGRCAVARIGKMAYSLICTDIDMPGADGVAVLAAARKLPEEERPVVFVVSGMAGEVSSKELLALGATAVFRKPFDIRELLAAVEDALSSSGATSPDA